MILTRTITLSLLCLMAAWPSDGRQFPDWLVTKITNTTQLLTTQKGTIILTNGLIAREFLISPDFATLDYYSYEKESSLIRALSPETTISLDGVNYDVGAVTATIPRAYMNRTALANGGMTLNKNAFSYNGYHLATPIAPFNYRPRRGAPTDITWPPKGLRLDVNFKAPVNASKLHQGVMVTVHYEMYDGIPLLSKWVTMKALSPASEAVQVSLPVLEYLGLNQQWAQQGYNWFNVETNEPHGTLVTWGTDPAAGAMPGSFEPILTVTYQDAFSVVLSQPFESFRAMELVVGSADKERVALSRHRMLRLLAPHTQENPVFFHQIYSDSARMRATIDQMAEVGFEMMIYSFGSGFKLETTDAAYLAAIKADIDYAKAKGIEVGGYDLIVLDRNLGPNYTEIDPTTNKTLDNLCMASAWYDTLSNYVNNFLAKTGLSMLETDGPYGGGQCGATFHTHHTDLSDSRYWQTRLQGEFFMNLRNKEVYINQPDNFFYQGGSRTGLGYNENQYSLPRWQDISVSRQSLFDDTFVLIPTAGWMFVPLVDYHGGGAAAAFEPLTVNIQEYEWALAQYLGGGVAACYRGFRLFDGNATQALVTKWVKFYKTYRDIVTSDIVHVRRPDMQSVDSFMHVNPYIKNRGLAMVFNPTDLHLQGSLTLPLYYTGLTDVATVSEQGGPAVKVTLERDYSIDVKFDLPALGITWFLIQ